MDLIREKKFLLLHKKILSLKDAIIKRITFVINKKLGFSGNLDNYKIVWNQLEKLANPEIQRILEENFPECKIIVAKSKSTYPDILMEFEEFRFAIDIKSNESSKDPWYDIARLDTIIESRLNKYDEEYELVIKYDSKNGKLLEIFFETLRDTVGVRKECNGVKYRPYDGKLRPKNWQDFSRGISYWKTKEKFLDGIEKSKKHRWKELARYHAKNLNEEEKKEFRDIFKCFFSFLD